MFVVEKENDRTVMHTSSSTSPPVYLVQQVNKIQKNAFSTDNVLDHLVLEVHTAIRKSLHITVSVPGFGSCSCGAALAARIGCDMHVDHRGVHKYKNGFRIECHPH